MPPKRKVPTTGKGKKKAPTKPDVIQLSDSDDNEIEIVKEFHPEAKKRKLEKQAKIGQPNSIKSAAPPASGGASKNGAKPAQQVATEVVKKKEEPADDPPAPAVPPVVQPAQVATAAAVATTLPTSTAATKQAPSVKVAKKSLSASNVHAKRTAVCVPVEKPPQEVQPQPVIQQQQKSPKKEPKQESTDPTTPVVAGRASSAKRVKQSTSHDSVLAKTTPAVTPRESAKPKTTSLQDYHVGSVTRGNKRKAAQMEEGVSPPRQRATRSGARKETAEADGEKSQNGAKRGEKAVQSRSKTTVVRPPTPPKTKFEERTTVDKLTVEKKHTRAANSAEQAQAEPVQTATTTQSTEPTVPTPVAKTTVTKEKGAPNGEQTSTAVQPTTNQSIGPTELVTVAKPTVSTEIARPTVPTPVAKPAISAEPATEKRQTTAIVETVAANRSHNPTVPTMPVQNNTVADKEKASEPMAGVARHLQLSIAPSLPPPIFARPAPPPAPARGVSRIIMEYDDPPLRFYNVVVGPIGKDDVAMRVNRFFCDVAAIKPLRPLSTARCGFLSLSFYSQHKELEALSLNPLLIGRSYVQVTYPTFVSVHYDSAKLLLKDVEEFLVSIFATVCSVESVGPPPTLRRRYSWEEEGIQEAGRRIERTALAKMVNANEVIRMLAIPNREWKDTTIRMEVADLSTVSY